MSDNTVPFVSVLRLPPKENSPDDDDDDDKQYDDTRNDDSGVPRAVLRLALKEKQITREGYYL